MPPAMKSLRPAVPLAATSRSAAATSVGALRRDAGRVARGPDEHVVAVQHEAAGRLERARRRDERRLGGRAVGERELRLAGAHVAQGRGAVGAHVAHRDALAARDRNEHRAHESRLRQRRRALDGHAARGSAGARRCGQRGCDEQAGEQAAHDRTLRARAAPVKLGPSSLAPWPRACATTCRTRCASVETEWITLSDGTRLAARLWLPEGAGRVPADPRVPALPAERRHAGGRPPADGLVRRPRLRLRPRRHPRHGQLGRDHRGRVLRAGAAGRARGHRLAGRAAVVRRARSAWWGRRGAASTGSSSRRARRRRSARSSASTRATTATPTTCTTAAGS